tara:strand:- start:169 stop:378 length:210 start_codon:yes stop_codon:yes gene_type:complete
MYHFLRPATRRHPGAIWRWSRAGILSYARFANKHYATNRQLKTTFKELSEDEVDALMGEIYPAKQSTPE